MRLGSLVEHVEFSDEDEEEVSTGTVCKIGIKGKIGVTAGFERSTHLLTNLRVLPPPPFNLRSFVGKSFGNYRRTCLLLRTAITLTDIPSGSQPEAVIPIQYMYSLLRSVSCLLYDQSTLRNALKCEDILERVFSVAIRPSPLRAVFSKQEIETAVLTTIQHLVGQMFAPVNPIERSTSPEPTTSRNVRTRSAHSRPNSALMASINQPQLLEMGFSQKNIEQAVKALLVQQNDNATCLMQGLTGTSPSPESIVSWLLEHQDQLFENYSDQVEECDSSSFEEHSSSSSLSEIDMSDTLTGIANTENMYRRRFEFFSDHDYARYVKDCIQVGMAVRCCRAFENIQEGDVGDVVSLDFDGLHDLNVKVNWQKRGNYSYWVRYVNVEILESVPGKIKLGDLVRVRPSISNPRYQWGSVTHASVGTLVDIKGQRVTVYFHEQHSWIGLMREIELVSTSPCGARRLSSRISCKKKTQSREGELFYEPTECIKNFTVSSGTMTAHHLFETNQKAWQSTGEQCPHWIRLEMNENVAIEKLAMDVDPVDLSHMPSFVVVSAGQSLQHLKPLQDLLIGPTDTRVTLLEDQSKYFRFVEIRIKQCRIVAIDCKVLGLIIIGRHIQSTNDAANYPFLAHESDIESKGITTSTNGTSVSGRAGPTGVRENIECKVFVWGLNDKDQLGGLKGSKIKEPRYSEVISALKPVDIAGGSKSLFIGELTITPSNYENAQY